MAEIVGWLINNFLRLRVVPSLPAAALAHFAGSKQRHAALTLRWNRKPGIGWNCWPDDAMAHCRRSPRGRATDCANLPGSQVVPRRGVFIRARFGCSRGKIPPCLPRRVGVGVLASRRRYMARWRAGRCFPYLRLVRFENRRHR